MTAFLFSSGKVEDNSCDDDNLPGRSCGHSFKEDSSLQNLLIYHVFGLFWISQFIIAFAYFVIASVIAQFYWLKREARSFFPTWKATVQGFRYYIGSLALGSFILALVQFIRWIIEYCERKVKKWGENNAFIRWFCCCIKCCLRCLQCMIQYINRQAYIMVSWEGGEAK